jgi:hypothetical protein
MIEWVLDYLQRQLGNEKTAREATLFVLRNWGPITDMSNTDHRQVLATAIRRCLEYNEMICHACAERTNARNGILQCDERTAPDALTMHECMDEISRKCRERTDLKSRRARKDLPRPSYMDLLPFLGEHAKNIHNQHLDFHRFQNRLNKNRAKWLANYGRAKA